MKTMKSERKMAIVLCLSPIMFGFLLFMIIPIVISIMLSFTNWDLITPIHWVNMKNYIELFHDRLFWKSLMNTVLYWAYTVPPLTIIALILALIVDRISRGAKFFRAVYFLPAVCPMVALAMIWRWVYQPNFGVLNFLFNKIGLPPQAWLSSELFALPAIAFIRVWRDTGYQMIILFAGLKTIPSHLYKAAEIDGATSWHKFWKITLPLLRPSLLFVTITTTIWSFQVFDEIWMVTQGGPGDATRVYNYYLYQNAFSSMKMGYASAMSVVLLLILVLITLLQFRVGGWE